MSRGWHRYWTNRLAALGLVVMLVPIGGCSTDNTALSEVFTLVLEAFLTGLTSS